MSAERGLAYWPAKRPTRTTGSFSPCTSTRLICSSTLSRLEMTSELHSAKVSAQSPPCSRNRLPSCASASCCLSARISREVTSGGSARSSSRVAASASASGYVGICSACLLRQLDGDQSAEGAAAGGNAIAGVVDIADKPGSAALHHHAAAPRPQPLPAEPVGMTMLESGIQCTEAQRDKPDQRPHRHRQAEELPVDVAAVTGRLQ